MTNVLEVRLHGPTRHDLSDIGEFDVRFVVAHVAGHATESDLVAVERADAIGKAGVDDTYAEFVIGAAWDEATEDNSAVELNADEIAVGRSHCTQSEDVDAAIRTATAHPVQLLVDDAIDSVIAAMLDRKAVTGWIG